ncbi:hypothetical protein ILUMI_04439, partial [Ignelater luminosus]
MYIIPWILQFFCYLFFANASNEEGDSQMEVLSRKSTHPSLSIMSFIEKLDKLDKYLAIIAKKTGREYMFLSVYHGVITTENDESVINRKDKKITCTGKKAVLELRRGKRKCAGGRFEHQTFEWNKICGPRVARSSLYFNGMLMHCVGSRKIDVVAGKLKCTGQLFTDEEMNLRCPIAGNLPVNPSTWIAYDGGINGLNQWGTLGKYNLGFVGCDSGITVSFQQDGKRYYCMGEGVHVVDFTDGFRYKCNDRQLTSIDYLHMCGNNGNMPNEFERPAFVNIDATSTCPGKLIAVRAFHDDQLLGFCLGHTTLITFTPPDVIFCHGGIPLTASDTKTRCQMAPAETAYIKT